MIYRVKIDFGYHNMVFDYKTSEDAIRLASDLFNHYSVDNTRHIEISVLLLPYDVEEVEDEN